MTINYNHQAGILAGNLQDTLLAADQIRANFDAAVAAAKKAGDNPYAWAWGIVVAVGKNGGMKAVFESTDEDVVAARGFAPRYNKDYVGVFALFVKNYKRLGLDPESIHNPADPKGTQGKLFGLARQVKERKVADGGGTKALAQIFAKAKTEQELRAGLKAVLQVAEPEQEQEAADGATGEKLVAALQTMATWKVTLDDGEKVAARAAVVALAEKFLF